MGFFWTIGAAMSQVATQVALEKNEIKAKRQSLADRKIALSQNGDDDEYITL
ncbi:hypothetical protein [Campylobacter hyointestinalis]|uniref:hypothetical protein n=1 Tax=Campylobacter hyointestinalis TaxID=198 RepID=UPI0015EEEF5F|nr:hypothetical protein [Campylobacter hyointestinalis]